MPTNPWFLDDLIPDYANMDNTQYPNSPLDPLKDSEINLDKMFGTQNPQMEQLSSILTGASKLPPPPPRVPSALAPSPNLDLLNDILSPFPKQYPNSPMDPQGPKEIPREAMKTLDDASKARVPKKASPKPEVDKPMIPTVEFGPKVTEEDAGDRELQAAMDDRRRNMMMLALMEGGQTIGSSIAGTKPVEGYTRSLEDLAQSPLQELKEKRASQKDKRETEKDKRSAEREQMEMDQAKEMLNSKSQSSEVARKTTKDMLTKIGYKTLADKITDNMSAKQIHTLMGGVNIQNLMQQYESMQNRLEMAKVNRIAKDESAKSKMDEKDMKRLDGANKLIQASINRNNTAFGRSANNLRAAQAIETLVESMDPKDMDSRQITELARSLDAMLSAGSPTITGMMKLIPRSARGDAAKIAEYITSRPKGAGQQEFIHRMMDTVKREKELAQNQISTESRKMLSSFHDLKKKQPDAWNLMLRENGLDPDMFDAPPGKTERKYDAATETGISAFMSAHPELSREEAINVLKENGRIK